MRAHHEIGPKSRIEVGPRTRIPDGITDEVLTEVKNVQKLAFTRQLKDFLEYSESRGLRFDLFIRPTTKMTGPLIEAIRHRRIIVRHIP